MRRPVALVLLAVVAACGGDDPAPVAGDGAVVPSGEIDIELTGPVDVPASFPDVVPVPSDILVEQAEEHRGEASRIFELTGWFDGDPVLAGRDYQAQLERRGFEIVSRSEAAESLFYVATSGEWYLSAGFFPDPLRGQGTSVGLTVAPAG